jgi:XTP/dITP diphosphohydrolase
MELPVVLATANPDKAREICEIVTDVVGHSLAAYALGVAADDRTVAFFVTAPDRLAGELGALPALVTAPDVEETGATLEANARIKARGVCALTGVVAIADDTGLEVDALDGAPGVHSARYAGDDASYADNVQKLLAELARVDAAEGARTARFATVAMACWPDGRELAVRGEVEGRIADVPRGEGGFGYDAVFVPAEGDGRTFAEMAAEEKHALSHRGRAFRALAVALDRAHGG